MVTELNLSFDGFVEKSHEKSTDINNLKYFGMSLVHHHPFTLEVETPDMEENKNNPEHCEITLKVEKPDKEENKNNPEHREKRRQKGA